ncbi:hypothetical protein [Auraticoccus monumenti]|uniref:Excreted virulence factor EspC, type VII ESX diderm n=1 Tax=Auraticoccus monumenti TaxID=675864 RepID=A0A1G6Y8W1_9ACTN|nr:hypothetical protein [Auraticoccus monumenti]SDD86934.1 hypothetical protein SAMN04489747_1937 [Auraticoccus monumenti]
MSQPSADDISRSLSDLRTCAKAFDAEGVALAARSGDFSGQGTGALSFGIFLAVGAAYDRGCSSLAGAAEAGGKALQEVATTLGSVADAYERDEENNVHASQGEW